jgi:hypothetical protein
MASVVSLFRVYPRLTSVAPRDIIKESRGTTNQGEGSKQMRTRKTRRSSDGWECPTCGHSKCGHREEPEILYHQVIRDGDVEIIEEKNPLHVPLEFHCSHDGCSCVIKYVGKYPV